MKITVGNYYGNNGFGAEVTVATDNDRIAYVDHMSGDYPIDIDIRTMGRPNGVRFTPAEARTLGAALIAAAREQESF